MSVQKALAALRTDEALELLKELVSIPSPSGQEQPAAEFFHGRLTAAGYTNVQRDGVGNTLVTLRGPRPGPKRAFFTHFDSAGAGNMQDPYVPAVLPGETFGKTGPVLRGLGASAPKSAVAAMFAAGNALRRAGLPQEGTLYLAFVTKDMHANHAGPREVLQSFPFEAEWMVASEPSSNQLVLGARGINHYRVELTGKPTHNGRPTEGANPLYALALLLDDLAALELPKHRVLGPATVSPFEVGSQAAPPLTPHVAHLVIDRRTLPGESTNDVEAGFRKLAEAAAARVPGVSATLTRTRAMHSLDTPPDAPVVKRLQAAVQAALGHELATTYITFSSNSGFGVTEKGWEGVGFGPGSINDLGADEHVSLAEVEEAAKIYTALMLA